MNQEADAIKSWKVPVLIRTSYVDTKPKQHQQHTYAIDAIDSAFNRSLLGTAAVLAAN